MTDYRNADEMGADEAIRLRAENAMLRSDLADAHERIASLEARLNEAEAELQRAEAVLVAADRVREAYDAMVEGRDIGSLPMWDRSLGRRRASITDPEGGTDNADCDGVVLRQMPRRLESGTEVGAGEGVPLQGADPASERDAADVVRREALEEIARELPTTREDHLEGRDERIGVLQAIAREALAITDPEGGDK